LYFEGDEMKNERLTMTIEEFATVCSISKGLSYDLARRNALIASKIGSRKTSGRRGKE
jgi:hypothetical protein